MKSCRRCLSLFCCLVLLFTVFSSHANAEASVQTQYHNIYVTSNITTDYGSYDFDPFLFYSNNGTIERVQAQNQIFFTNPIDTITRNTYYYVGENNQLVIAEKGRSTFFRLENCYERMSLLRGSEYNSKYLQFGDSYGGSASAVVYYVDGSTKNVKVTVTTKNTGQFDLTTENFIPDKDILKVCFITTYSFSGSWVEPYFDYNGIYYWSNVTLYLGEWGDSGDKGWSMIRSQETGETSWLVKIWNQLVSGFDSMVTNLISGFQSVLDGFRNSVTNLLNGMTDLKNWLVSLWTAIIDLPSQLWQKMQDGLINLFVPKDGFFEEWFDRMWELYLEKTGVMGQCVEAVHRVVDAIAVFEPSGTIKLPVVTIPLPDDNTFSFGGYDVKIVPDGFDFLLATVKTVLSIVCTVAFFGGMRQRYDEFVGVDK